MAKNDYTEAVGRRKTASARVRISSAKSASMTVNGKTAEEYFPLEQMVKTGFLRRCNFSVRVLMQFQRQRCKVVDSQAQAECDPPRPLAR